MAKRKPNILYIICHDLGQHLNCYGHGTVNSPALDKLAGEGVRFENYFCASTPCTPSRGCIMTGKYAHVSGCTGLTHLGFPLPDNQKTVVNHLNDGGYDTWHVGLQHERNGNGKNSYRHVISNDCRMENVANDTIKLLESGKLKEPFYLNSGSFEVHLPFDKPEYTPADPEKIDVPGWLPDNKYVREELAGFHGCIEYMDKHIGRILDSFNRSSYRDNTVVVFTTDHGMAFPRAKSTMYDPGIETALLMKFPESMGIRGGVKTELLHNVELGPTLLEIAGIAIPGYMQGRSFLPLLKGGKYRENEYIFSEKNFHDIYDPMRCVRTGRFKYIRNFEKRRKLPLPRDIEDSIASKELIKGALDDRPDEEFYDLQKDPLEFSNLMGNPDYAGKINELKGILQEWMEKTNDPILRGSMPLNPDSKVREYS